jgi:membrane fusion protein (multidrug efflux system)
VVVPSVRVTTVKAARRLMPRYATLTGSIVADRESDVAADVTGKILSASVERGAEVKAGAVLAVLDRRSASISSRGAAVDAQLALTQSDLAHLDCARADELLASGALGRSEYERIKAQCHATALSVDAARARQDAALKLLGDAVIKAPFAGVVSERYVNVGEYVQPQSRIVHLVSTDPVRVRINVPEQQVADVSAGMGVEVNVSAHPDAWFAGTIRYFGASLRELTRDLLVEASVPNPEQKLRPGMFAVVRIVMPREQVVVVPQGSLREVGVVARLFVERDGHLEERLVELGVRDGQDVEVRKGVEVGELVVSPVTLEAVDGAQVVH